MAFGFATSSRSDFVHHMHIMAPRLRCRKGKSGLEDRQIVHLGQGTLRPMKSSNASMEKWVRELGPGVPKSNTESIGIHRPCSLADDSVMTATTIPSTDACCRENPRRRACISIMAERRLLNEKRICNANDAGIRDAGAGTTVGLQWCWPRRPRAQP